jgi:hypothetical protein
VFAFLEHKITTHDSNFPALECIVYVENSTLSLGDTIGFVVRNSNLSVSDLF